MSQQTPTHIIKAQLQKIEAEVAQNPSACFRYAADGLATLHTTEGQWCAGRFETPSIQELKSRLKPPEPTARLSLKLLLDPQGKEVATDIGYLQATDDGHNLFQVASQFNCLEAPSAHITPVQNYLYDPTQGPRASISAFPGTFLRHYQAPGPHGRFVQSPQSEINLLKDAIGPHGRVKHGYLQRENIADLAAVAQHLEDHFEQIRVGLHAQVSVVYGYNWGGPVLGNSTISQVFSSTYALAYSAGPSSPHDRAICRSLLRGAYLGSLLGAVVLGKQRIVLTLIGGGVFGNPLDQIWQAILWACDQTAPLLPHPLTVEVNTRRANPEHLSPQWMEDVQARQGQNSA